MKVRKPRLAAFPERLTQAWQASGMTRCELAKRLGYNQAMVSHWMLGRSEPGLACLVEMAGILGVTPGYLLGEDQSTLDPLSVRRALDRMVGAMDHMIGVARDLGGMVGLEEEATDGR